MKKFGILQGIAVKKFSGVVGKGVTVCFLLI